MDKLLEAVGLSGAELTHTSPTFWEVLSRSLINPVVGTLLLMMGFFFLVVEILTAGFGIFGIGGLIAVFVAIVLAAASISLGLYILFRSFFIACAAGYVAFKYFQRKGTLKSFILSGSATREAGYSSSEDYSHLLGKKGRTVTPMHPSGIVEIEGKRYDAISEGGYINAVEYVEVVKVEGSRILIRVTK